MLDLAAIMRQHIDAGDGLTEFLKPTNYRSISDFCVALGAVSGFELIAEVIGDDEGNVGFVSVARRTASGAIWSAAASQSVSFIKLGSLFPQRFDLFSVPLIPQR